MKYVKLEVTLYDEQTRKFHDNQYVLVREDWVFDRNNPMGKLGKWNEVGMEQCVKNDNGEWVFVYPSY